MHCALVKNGVVENIIVAETDFIDSISADYEAIVPLDPPSGPYVIAGIGWTYSNGVFTPPVAAPAPDIATDMRITVLKFRERFTRDEKASIEMAAIDDPSATMEQRRQAAALRSDLKDRAAASFIDLADKSTIDGVNEMEALGLLATGRANEILTTPILPSERP